MIVAASSLPPLPSTMSTKNESVDNMAAHVMPIFIYERPCRSNSAPATNEPTTSSRRGQSPKSTAPTAYRVVKPALRAANTPERYAVATVRRTTARRNAAFASGSSCHLAPYSRASTESPAALGSKLGLDSSRSLARRAPWSNAPARSRRRPEQPAEECRQASPCG